MNKSKARQNWFFIITTDDGDRYLYEVYARGEMVEICWRSEDANRKLEQLWNDYCEHEDLDPNEED